MIEKINKVNDVLEQLVIKLKNNYERLEKRAIQAEREIDEDATSTEYEALALLKKDAIMNKILYQYYSQKLRMVMDRAMNSVVEMAAISGSSESFELEISAKDFTNINLEELCKGVRSNAVTEEILSSFEMFSGNSVAPKETLENSKGKIAYEGNESCAYNINATDDEFILARGGNGQTSTEDFMTVGGGAQPLTEEVMHAGGSAMPLTREAMMAGGDAVPLQEKFRYAGGDASESAERFTYAGGNASPLSEDLMNAGGASAPLEDLISAGGSAQPVTEELMHAGGSASPLTEDLKFAGGDAEPVQEKLRYAGGDASSEVAKKKSSTSSSKSTSKKDKKTKFSSITK